MSIVIDTLHPNPLPLAGLQNQKQHSNNQTHLTGKSRIYEHLCSLVERAALHVFFRATSMYTYYFCNGRQHKATLTYMYNSLQHKTTTPRVVKHMNDKSVNLRQ